MARCCLAVFLAVSLLAHAFCAPPSFMFRGQRDPSDNDISSSDSDLDEFKDTVQPSKPSSDKGTKISEEDDEFGDDEFKPSSNSSGGGGGGSNIASLINLASALIPSLSGNSVKKNNEFVKKIIRDAINQYKAHKVQKRKDTSKNVIEIDSVSKVKPHLLERQESEEDHDDDGSDSESEEDNGAEESVEEVTNDTNKQDSGASASNANDGNKGSGDDNDSDYDEPPEGDGEGGILGLLAGLSGDGESDLGSLLAAVGGIVANLSGDGVDINALIATGLGLFVGLLSDEGSNPGEIIGSYLLTSLDTISGGGAQNNGAFFGNFLSTLVKGTSAEHRSEGTSPFMSFKMDIFRAFLQLGTKLLGLGSSGTTSH